MNLNCHNYFVFPKRLSRAVCHLVTFALASLIVLSCRSDLESEFFFQNQNCTVFNDSLIFEFLAEKSFERDSLTPAMSYSVGIHEGDNSDTIFISNLSAAEDFINIYNYIQGNLVSKIPLFPEGPNGVGFGNGLMAHRMINSDSVLVYNYYLLSMFLLDGEGNLIRKYSIQERYVSGQDEAIPWPSSMRPIIVVQDKAYLMGSLIKSEIENKEQAGMVISVDLQTGEVKRFLSRSEVYDWGNWNSHNLKHDLFGDFNPLTGRFVYSFAADPFLYETDHDEFFKKHFVGSQFFQKILPMGFDKRERYDSEKVEFFDKTTPSFHKLIFDKHRRLYYRFCFLPLTESEYVPSSGVYNAKESIIILDEDFRKVGEFLLPRFTYEFYNFFLTKEGLHLKLKSELEVSDDVSTYHIFRVVAKK